MIKAKVIADSVGPTGIRITTFEIEYPRFILAELNTHRMLSKNSASSRAIPVNTLHDLINEHPAMPVHWGKNQPGMSAKEELDEADKTMAEFFWQGAKRMSLHFAKALSGLGLHKQVANRVCEPFQIMKTVITGTEWNNLYYLRNHRDAQPEFQALAAAMLEAHKASKPRQLEPGEWHLPYVWLSRDMVGGVYYRDSRGEEISLDDAIAISASCCAQVSYRKNDDTVEKARAILDKLINSKPAHSSPTEHQATPMPERFLSCEDTRRDTWLEGISHQSKDGHYWSGNLRGWIQHRKLLVGEAIWGTGPGAAVT